MKKVIIIAGVILCIIIVIAVAFYFRFQQMARVVDREVVTDIDLIQIEDGVYIGEYHEFLVAIKVEVTIEDHKITKIDIIEQQAGPGYEATETVERIIKAQSPKVDAVSGATGSSKTIMIAVRNALTGGE